MLAQVAAYIASCLGVPLRIEKHEVVSYWIRQWYSKDKRAKRRLREGKEKS
jgi:hypothetical protein